MKKTLVTLALVAVSVAAFAQGKVTIQNDPASAFTLGSAGQIAAADASLAGQAIPTTGALPSGAFLEVGLYAGTSASTMALVNVLIPLNTAAGTGLAAGTFTPTHAILPFEGGTVGFYQLKAWDQSFANYDAAKAAGKYAGEGSIFNMTAGLSTKLPYPGINNGGGTTWTAAPITVSLIPEPSTFALAGLGAAALLIFRRRK
jgi:hypothetical protein